MKNLLDLEPIQKFIKTVGKNVEKYLGEDPSCIVYLRPDGTFYGVALYEWLRRKKSNLTLATMEDDGKGLDELKVKGRKVLIVDNDIIRISLPPLSDEYRKDLLRFLSQKQEETKKTIRRWRDQVWDEIQDKAREGEIREDDKFRAKEDLQKMVDECHKKIEEMGERKKKEIIE